MAATVTIERQAAINLYLALGWKTADKWKNSKLVSSIPEVKDVAPNDPLPNEADAKLLTDILAGIELGSAFEVVGEEGSANSAATGTVSGGEKPAKEPKTKKEKKVKEPKAKKEKKVKQPKPEGIQTLGRGYYAGQVIKRHGLEKGITDEMAAEVDALYGKANTDVSKGALKWAHDALTGFNATPLPLPDGYKYVAPETTAVVAAEEQAAAVTQ